MLRGTLSSALFASPFFSLLLAPSPLIAGALSTVALPDLTLLPLDAFLTRISAKLRLHHHIAIPDRVTLPTGLITFRPLCPLWHGTVYCWKHKNGQKEKYLDEAPDRAETWVWRRLYDRWDKNCMAQYTEPCRWQKVGGEAFLKQVDIYFLGYLSHRTVELFWSFSLATVDCCSPNSSSFLWKFFFSL